MTAGNITISNATTGTISVGGSIGATTDLVLSSGSGGIALNAGHILTGATIDFTTTGGGVTQAAAGTISGTTLQSTGGIAGGAELINTTNTLTDIGPIIAGSGNIAIADSHAMTLTGAVKATSGNVYLEDAASGGINLVSFTVSSVSGGTVGLQTNKLTSLGATGAVDAGTGVFELSPDTAHAMTLGAASGLSLADLTGITAGTLRIGAVTQPGSASPTVIASSISIAGAFGNSATSIDLNTTTGAVTQSAALTAATLTGTINSGTLTDVGNAIATIGSLAVTKDFLLTDTGNLTAAGPLTAANITLNSGTITASGSVGATTALALTAGAGGIALNTGAVASGATVDLSTTGGVAEDLAATVSATTLQSSGGITNDFSLFSATNSIGSIESITVGGSVALRNASSLIIDGPLTTTNKNILVDAPGITVNGSISAPSDQINLFDTGSVGITLNTGAVVAAPSVRFDTTNTLSLLGNAQVGQAGASIVFIEGSVTQAATSKITGGINDNSNATADIILAGTANNIDILNAFTLGAGSTFSLVDNGNTGNLLITFGVTGKNISISDANTGTITVNNAAILDATGSLSLSSGSGGILANTGALLSGATVDLSATGGGITEAAGGTISATTLLRSTSGVTGTADLIGTANSIASVGSFAVITGDFNLIGVNNVGLAGKLTATNISISGGTITATGSVGATTDLKLAAGKGGIALNTGEILSGTTVDLNATGGGVSQVTTGIVSATTLQSSTGVTGGVTLVGTANAISGLAGFTASTGNFALADLSVLTLAGDLTATTGNIYLEDSAGGGIDFATFKVTSQSGGTIGVRANALANPGVINAGATGLFELAPDTANPLTLGSASGLSLTNLTGITAGVVRIGAITQPGSASPTVIANAISIAGAFDVGGANLDLETTGAITQSAALTGVATLTGTAASGTLTLTGNSIATLGSFATTGDFSLLDDGNTGNLTVSGPVTGSNVSISDANTGTISVTGSVGATTLLALSSGTGGIALNTGEILSGATVDLSAAGGGVTQVATGTITATTSLLSGSGVTGTVDLAGTSNAIAAIGSFAVTSGDFTLVDTGDLTAAGKLTATNITLTSPTIAATGSVGATTLLTLAGGAGGIALNTGEVLTGATVDLSSTSGAVTQVSTGTIGATVLQSTGGFANGLTLNGTANLIGTLAAMTASVGNIGVVDNEAGSFVVNGLVKATTGNVYLNEVLSTGTIDFTATGSATAAASGIVGLEANAFSATSGFAISAGTLELAPNPGQAFAVSGGAGFTGAGISVGTVRMGAITLPGSSSPTITATSLAIDSALALGGANLDLQTSGAVTQSAALTGVGTLTGNVGSATITAGGNAIADLGSFAATGSFSLTDTGNLAVSGPVTGGDIALTSATITATGSVGATGTALLDATAGAIALNTGEILSGATVDLSATGGVAQVATGTITATRCCKARPG